MSEEKEEIQMNEKREVSPHKAEHVIGRQTYAPVQAPVGEKIKPHQKTKRNSNATIDR